MIISYRWLQTYFDTPLPPPPRITEVLTFGIFEVEGAEKKGNDTIFDVKVLPDRAHDCLSHRGIAHVLAALLDMPLRAEDPPVIPAEAPATLSVRVSDEALCRRYVGRAVRGVKVGPSPSWLVERLESIGQRSINNIVDAANFVMFDLGQPLHAFDADKVSGGIVVRHARAEESITTLDNKEIALPEHTLLIADDEGPLAIAGVKGGMSAEVGGGTENIILEAANFDPIAIRKTSRGLGILTDSSRRFENELTPELAREAMDRVTALIMEIAGGTETTVESAVDVYPHPPEARTVAVSARDVNRLLGTDMTEHDVSRILTRLGFAYAESDGAYVVSVPPQRLDLKEMPDIAEDIAHIFGYAHIPSRGPKRETAAVNKKFYYMTCVRNALARAGFSEIYGYTFAEEGEVEIANPLQKDKKFLRTNLTDGMLDALSRNIVQAPLFGAERVALFEFGNVFHKTSEKTLLAVGVHHGKKVKEGIVKKVLAQIAEEIGAPSLPTIDGYDLTDRAREAIVLDIDALVVSLPEPAEAYQLPESVHVQYKPFSPYPFIARDIAVWVPKGATKESVSDIIVAEGGDLLVRAPALFDEFQKDDKVSYAFRFVFQAPDRTLTDEEVNAIMERIHARLRALGFTVR